MVFLSIEEGLDAIETTKIDIKTYGEFIEAITALYEQEHEFKTVAVDSLDWLENLIHRELCTQYAAKSIDDSDCKAFAYGKGYKLATVFWREILAGLDALREEKGMTILLIAHDQIKRFEDPTTDSYDRYMLKLHNSACDLVTEWSDCLLFAQKKVFTSKEDAGFNKKKTKAVGGERVIYTEESPAFMAGNRYNLPEEIPLSWDDFVHAFEEATK